MPLYNTADIKMFGTKTYTQQEMFDMLPLSDTQRKEIIENMQKNIDKEHEYILVNKEKSDIAESSDEEEKIEENLVQSEEF